MRTIVGSSWWVEPWLGLDLHFTIDVTAPGLAFADAMLFIAPEIGVAIAY